MRKLQHKGVRSLLICLLAVVFVLPLAACSGKPKTSSTSGTATTTDPDTVSYTHLDVYKRQIQARPVRGALLYGKSKTG